MADFLRSNLKVFGRDGSDRPWRWTTDPVYNPDGSIATPGVKQTPNGVFILLSDAIIEYLKTTMTQAQKDEILPWINRYTADQAAMWHVSLWAGDSSAVIWRIPATIWDDPTTVPPLKVRTYFRDLFA